MRRNVDKNSNGAIDFNEFIEMMLRRDSKVEEDVVHAFRYKTTAISDIFPEPKSDGFRIGAELNHSVPTGSVPEMDQLCSIFGYDLNLSQHADFFFNTGTLDLVGFLTGTATASYRKRS